MGDQNHEGVAYDFLRRKIMEACDMRVYDEYDWDEVVKSLVCGLADVVDTSAYEPISTPAPDDADSVHKFVSHFREELDLQQEDIDHAFERRSAGDVRLYMCKQYGWITCHGNRFCVWYLTRESAERISEAVGDILEQEGSLSDDAELEIFVGSTGKTYTVSWRVLELGDFSSLQWTPPPAGPNAQVAAMDRALEHPYYRNAENH